MHPYAPGELIANRYEVASRPLMGGMGIVYLCLDHDNSGRPVALKTFKPEYLPDRDARDRFLREGALWVSLGSHPHIVRCYQVVRVGDGREVYLVLELIANESRCTDASLRSWLVSGKPLPLEQSLLIALQVARGMRHATDVIPSLVHRDLKPENLLVGADYLSNTTINRVRVTDFGLASVLQGTSRPSSQYDTIAQDEVHLSRTQLTHGVVGTPWYMAPEQWREEPVGVATDVYALGCVLIEMLTGHHAVQGSGQSELRQAHCRGEALASAESLPESQQMLLRQCLSLKPEERLRTWGDMETAVVAMYMQSCRHAAPDPEAPQVLARAEQVTAGWSYNNIGHSYFDLGKADVAERYFGQAQEMGRALGERKLYGTGLSNKGLVYVARGEAQQAIGHLQQALTIAREIADQDGEGAILSTLGTAYKNLGEVAKAISYHEQALVVFRATRDYRAEGAVLSNLGLAYSELGEIRRAIGYFEHALVIASELGDRPGEGRAMGNLGLAYAHLAENRLAISYSKQALIIHHEIGERRGEGSALGNLGSVYWQLGEIQQAINYFEQALVIDREVGDKRSERIALGSLGSAYWQQGDAQRAIGYYEQALTIHYELGNATGAARDSLNIAVVYSRQGNVSRALQLAQQAVKLYVQIGDTEQAQQAQQLVDQLQSGDSNNHSDTEEPIQQALEAFLMRASTLADMRRASVQYPILIDLRFITTIEKMIMTQVPPRYRPTIEERLAWLRKIAQGNEK